MDVLQWIESWFDEAPEIRSAFPGGIHLDRAEPRTPGPYLLVDVISEVPSWETEDGYGEAVRVQFTAVAAGVAEARALRELLARHPVSGLDRVDSAPLGVGGDAVVVAIRAGGSASLDGEPAPDAGKAALATLDYVFLLSREGY